MQQEKNIPFGKHLREAMQIGKITQVQLAAKTGISQGAVSRYLNSKASPRGDELLRLSRALGVRMEWLLTGEGVRTTDELIEGMEKFMRQSPESPDFKVRESRKPALRAALEEREMKRLGLDSESQNAARIKELEGKLDDIKTTLSELLKRL